METDAFDHEIETRPPDALAEETRQERAILFLMAGVAAALAVGGVVWILAAVLGD